MKNLSRDADILLDAVNRLIKVKDDRRFSKLHVDITRRRTIERLDKWASRVTLALVVGALRDTNDLQCVDLRIAKKIKAESEIAIGVRSCLPEKRLAELEGWIGNGRSPKSDPGRIWEAINIGDLADHVGRHTRCTLGGLRCQR